MKGFTIQKKKTPFQRHKELEEEKRRVRAPAPWVLPAALLPPLCEKGGSAIALHDPSVFSHPPAPDGQRRSPRASTHRIAHSAANTPRRNASRRLRRRPPRSMRSLSMPLVTAAAAAAMEEEEAVAVPAAAAAVLAAAACGGAPRRRSRRRSRQCFRATTAPTRRPRRPRQRQQQQVQTTAAAVARQRL